MGPAEPQSVGGRGSTTFCSTSAPPEASGSETLGEQIVGIVSFTPREKRGNGTERGQRDLFKGCRPSTLKRHRFSPHLGSMLHVGPHQVPLLHVGPNLGSYVTGSGPSWGPMLQVSPNPGSYATSQALALKQLQVKPKCICISLKSQLQSLKSRVLHPPTNHWPSEASAKTQYPKPHEEETSRRSTRDDPRTEG